MFSTHEIRKAGTDGSLDFYVKMVLESTKSGGFLSNFCTLSPDEYLLQHGVWFKKESNYKMLKSLQITYTNDDREAGMTLSREQRKEERSRNWNAVKVYRETKKLPALLGAVLSTGETLMPRVKMSAPQLPVCPAPRTTDLATHESDACPTAESFGLPVQADAAGPRKKKTKVLRFLSAGESGESVPDVSTAGSGH